MTARPYPGFPTDAMPVLLAAQLGAQGKTSFTETIFENRFLYVQELQKLGAKLSQDGPGPDPIGRARSRCTRRACTPGICAAGPRWCSEPCRPRGKVPFLE